MSSDEFEQIWQGRVDIEDGDAGRRFHQVIKPCQRQHQEPGVVLAGLASDLGVQRNQGRTGAKLGPQALRRSLANLAWHFDQPLYDAGDVHIPTHGGAPLSAAQTAYAKLVSEMLGKRHFVIGMGGGHEIAWGSYQGARRHLDTVGYHSAKLGILNFDAHFDLRRPPSDSTWVGSSGTPFYQVCRDCKQRGHAFNYACLGISQPSNTRALFEFAAVNNVSYLLDEDCGDDTSGSLIDNFISGLDALYVTICLDVLPSSVAPGVSAPATLGISLNFIIEALELIREACDRYNVRWMMADIAELNPQHDINNQTANVAARLVYELIDLQ